MPDCVVCGGTEFYVEAGFYFCKECQTQNEDIREEVLELRIDTTTRLRKVRIRQDKSSTSERAQNLGWTTWEQYNFILIGLTNELVELGASLDIKMTILQLWAYYLGKLEVAFTSTTKKSVPRLARRFHQRDAEIIYGKIAQRKKSRKRGAGSNASASSVVSSGVSEGSSNRDINKHKQRMVAAEYERYVLSQGSSEGDATSVMNQSLYSVQSSAGKSSGQTEDNIQFNKSAKREAAKVKVLSMKLPRFERLKYRKKHVTSQYKTGPQVITPMKLWAVIYLALRIHDENIHLADMLRFGREGHLSYYRLDHLLPPEVTLSRSEVNLLHQTKEITHKSLRRTVADLAKYLEVWETRHPDFEMLLERYCTELQLPRGIMIYAKRMMSMAPPKMPFNDKTPCFPNYEGRAMAFIIVVMKILFALDGITEYEVSRVAEKINRLIMSTTETSSSGDVCVATPLETTEPCVIVHGGIGSEYAVTSVFAEMVTACRTSASLAYRKMLSGGSAVDAVEAALWWLENDEFFNCGYGSVVNNEGYVEMDACMVNGAKSECGSVAAIRDVEHPISVARYVMKHFPNTIVAGEGAKRFAKNAGINWISRESMIAPAAYFSNETKYPTSTVGYFEAQPENGSGEILKSCSLGAVGCAAWDGHSIVVGNSSGGSRGKMVGRIGASSLMGCGAFADKYSGCSVTGHGESIIKMGLARRIVEDCSTQIYTPQECLRNNLDKFTNLWSQRVGGIVLRNDGSWEAYSSSADPMPYAVVKNRRITFAAEGGEQKIGNTAAARSVLETRLFSFREWQRYIECRRSLLTNHHFPTKFKKDPDAPGNNHLFLRFIANVKSKSSDREEPEVKSYKHLIPRELTDAMKTSIEKLHATTHSAPNDIDIFGPSLTPQHSYLQQLLDDPERDLPTNLRVDFNSTKIGYVTNPETIQELAWQCDIDLEILDTAVHFIEKVVSPFEQSNLPTIKEFNKPVRVEQPSAMKARRAASERESGEDAMDYLNRKNPGILFVDPSKLSEYEVARKSLRRRRREFVDEPSDDFGFDGITPKGKLTINNDSDSDNESVRSVSIENEIDPGPNVNENGEPDIDFLAKYNLSLSNFEKCSLSESFTAKLPKKAKRKLERDPETGKFVSADRLITLEKTKNVSSRTRAQRKSTRLQQENKDLLSNGSENNLDGGSRERIELSDSCDFDLPDDDLSVLHDSNLYPPNGEIDGSHFLDSRSNSDFEKLYRPYSEYWMYRCHFSRVKQKNFRQFEKYLPDSFRWLLGECASVVEMTEEDLYEEVCLVESYYTDILKPSDCPSADSRCYNAEEYRSKGHRNSTTKKW